MFNTHSLPVRWDDFSTQAKIYPNQLDTVSVSLASMIEVGSVGRSFSPVTQYTGGSSGAPSTYSVNYWTFNAIPPNEKTQYQPNLLGLFRNERTVDAAPGPAGWDAPFFFEDRRNVFFVRTTESQPTASVAPPYGVIPVATAPRIPSAVLQRPPTGPDAGSNASLIASQRVSLPSTTPVIYQGNAIDSTGQTARVQPSEAAKV
jgi:hypothetical protein